MDRTRRLLYAALPPTAAAGIGGLAARNAKDVYRRLDTPSWAPPAAAFGPVWSALYALIGAAGWRLSGRSGPAARTAAAWHVAQLALNASWTPLFFAARRRRAALAVSMLLDAAVAAEIVTLARAGDPVSAGLLSPYLLWSGFATALTAAVGDPPR